MFFYFPRSPSPFHRHSFKFMLSTCEPRSSLTSASSDPETVDTWSSVLRGVLRQHPNTAEKTSTINLPGSQEGRMIACISLVRCQSDNLFRCKPTHMYKTPKSYLFCKKLGRNENHRKCIWLDCSSTHFSKFLKMEETGRLSIALLN